MDGGENLYRILISPKVKTVSLDNYTFYPKIQTKGVDSCNGENIMGSSEIKYRNLVMTKSFSNIPQHQGVIIHFRFYQIDDYAGVRGNDNSTATVYFKLNGKVHQYAPSV